MTAFPQIGGSNYHAASIDLNRRFSRSIMLRANYTWAHTIDDSTNELFSSVVNPRRPFDWMNLRQDRGRSTLDVRHKFAMSWISELPNLKNGYGALKTVTNGWQFTGTFIAQAMKLSERFSLLFRVNTFNTFNHRNFTLAQPSVFQTGSGGPIGTVNNALSTTYSNLTSPLFLDSRQFTGGRREMQLGVKLIW